jgi:hypothetical protein
MEKKMQTFSPVQVAQHLLRVKLRQARWVVDATVGNGNDTLFLARETPGHAIVWAFDIQETALCAAKRFITDHGFGHKVRFVLDSHSNVEQYIPAAIDVAMFNLGYLPGGNRTIVTKAESTLAALTAVLGKLSLGGVISVIVYPGHEQGEREARELQHFFSGLPSNIYTVGCWGLVNHSNKAPRTYLIEKVKEWIA